MPPDCLSASNIAAGDITFDLVLIELEFRRGPVTAFKDVLVDVFDGADGPADFNVDMGLVTPRQVRIVRDTCSLETETVSPDRVG
jgi:hypothetical protein